MLHGEYIGICRISVEYDGSYALKIVGTLVFLLKIKN